MVDGPVGDAYHAGMVAVSLDAVLVAVTDEVPKALVVPGASGGLRFPAGPLAADDRTLELGMRRVLQDQTGLEAGYAEQLYTFGDRGRVPTGGGRTVSVAYLLLTRALRVLPAFEVSLLILIEPVLNPIWAWLAHGESPGRFALIGGAVILAATLIKTLVGDRAGEA